MESLQPLAAAADPVAGPRPALPRESPLSAEAVREVRRFHLGAVAGGLSVGEGAEGMVPAALWPYRDPERLSTGFPLFLGPPATGEPALCLPAGELLARAARGPEIAGGALAEALPRLERALAETTAKEGAAEDPRSTVAAAAAVVIDELVAGGGEREPLEAELKRLAEAVPAGGRWVGLDAATALHLAQFAAFDRLLPAFEAFRTEAASLAERLAVLLAGDRLQRDVAGGGAEGAEEVEQEAADSGTEPFGADLGALGARFIDSGALAGMLARQRGDALEPERRQRLEGARKALARFAALEPPEPLLVAPPAESGAVSALPDLPGWRREEAYNVCAAAAERFDHEAAALAEVVRAARLARLELAGDYDPALHGPWLDRVDWQGFSRDELLLLPPIVAWLPADLAAGAGMVALSRLLLSGRPVQVVVPVSPAENPASPASGKAGDPAARHSVHYEGYRFEPAYLGLSHREALVQQTAAARPLHAIEGFRRGARAACTALHVVAIPPADGDGAVGAHLLAAAALEGRAHPFFHYDPEKGWSWARRFDFAGNPAPAADWPRYGVVAPAESDEAEETEESAETELEVAFTFADFALLEPAFAAGFLALPAGAAADELVPLADWLGGDEEETAPSSVPFVWAVDGDGRLRRVVVDRELALACRDRLDFWRTLQELSGARSEYARSAAEQAREEAAARARAERERFEAEHAEELARVEREVAERLATRLTEMLLSPEPPAGAGTAPGAAAAPGGATALAGGDPERVAAALLALVEPALEGDGPGQPAAPADPRVEETAERLLAVLGGGIDLEGEAVATEPATVAAGGDAGGK